MADAILADIAIDIVKKLGSLGLRETRLWWGVKEELEKLRVAVSMIQAVLLDAEEQYSLSHQVKMITGNKMLREVSLFFSSSNPFVYGLKMAHKIENVRSRLDEIAANRRFHLNECQEITAPMVEEREQTHSSLPQVVVGRKEDKKKIVDFLLSSSYGENVSIISIVGIGGLGKTTLAQLAYNDVMVKSYFELKILFPKGAKISIRYMMSLWLAQGFIRSSDSEQSFEDIGLKYFKNLLWRSFFQEVEEDIFGNLLSCKMHDLIHDLAVQVAGEENVLVNSDAQRVKKETRHVSLNFEVESWQKVASSLPNATKVRTFIPLKWSIRDDIKKVECQEIFSKLSHARVLNLQCLGERVPHSIDKLKHIRFLDLSENKRIEVLPNSIIKLQNLQFLYLVNCERLKQLPKHIKMLVNLQQLYLEGCESLTHMPCGIGQLSSLENLSVFMVAKDNGVSKHSGGLSELRDLNNLRGWLHIKNLRYVKDPASEFEAANLKEKQHLQTLILAWNLAIPMIIIVIVVRMTLKYH
ncbi:hypothetical protein GH714_002155 [Hevea brasiliensis]|uniref:Rx N-terminal domain-containing protein n=1 Tax=Hevea brasiliensis TaxID=3981 RepID=A0A6A6M992_HEVBR|nr:hypothetical protein GH714_002155 [Hevea brasiliensis]